MRPVGLERGEAIDLAGLVNDVPQVQARARLEVAGVEAAFEQEDRAAPAEPAQQLGLGDVEQRETVGALQRREHVGDAVAVGVGLDHRPDARARRGVARDLEIGREGVAMNDRFDRPRHGGILPAVRSRYRDRRGEARKPACYKPRRRETSRTSVPTCGSAGKRMKKGFYTIMSAQFFSSLADNALLVARDRVAPDRRCSFVARAGVDADVRALLRHPRAGSGRLRGRRAQGHGDADLEHDQDRRLPADAVRRQPAPVVRDRRPRRGGVLAGQVRHPHRAAAELAAGQGQRLDRGPDDPVDHLRRAARRPAARPRRLAAPARLRRADLRHRHRHRAGGGGRGDRHALHRRRALQPAHPAHRSAAAAAAAQRRRAGARLLELQRAPVERQARPDLAGDDDAVLGRLEQPARDRLRLGGGGARLHDDAGVVAGRRRRHRHRRRRDRRLDADAPRPGDVGHPATASPWACS